jgi:hypothetical protein
MPHLRMNRLGPGLGIDQNDIDTLIAQGDLQLRGQTTGHGRAIGKTLVDLDEQIDVTAARRLVEARPEQTHARTRAEHRRDGLMDDPGLGW